MTPRVSIVTVTKNSGSTIERTIQSVLGQSHQPDEYIFIDGQSVDNTLNIIQRHKPKTAMKYEWISEPDNGIYDAMNKGLRKATGDIIGIINGDDWYDSLAIEVMIALYMNNREGVYYGLVREYLPDDESRTLSVDHTELPWKMIPHPSCFVSRSLYEQYGYFDDQYRFAADLDLMVRFKKNNVQFINSQKLIAHYVHGGATHRHFQGSTREVFSILHKHNYITAASKYLHQLNEWRREISKRVVR